MKEKARKLCDRAILLCHVSEMVRRKLITPVQAERIRAAVERNYAAKAVCQ